MHPAIDGLMYALQDTFQDTFSASLKDGQKNIGPKRIGQKNIGFLRAELAPCFMDVLGSHTLYCHQSFKPEYDKLANAGLSVTPTLPETQPLDVVIYLPTRNREENKFMLAKATEWLKEGGVFISAQHNTMGAKQFEKDVRKLLPDVISTSKKHCRLLHAPKTRQPDSKEYNRYLALGMPSPVENTTMHTLPGLFSGKKIDAGSQMLVDVIEQEDLAGRGADFGAGWGFLSQRALKISPRIQEMHLFEAEHQALTCAEANISNFIHHTKHKSAKIFYHWSDISTTSLDPQFDFILCNPPQHNVSNADPTLVSQFIEQCARALKPGGCLWLVTNAHMPAKRMLTSCFAEVELKIRDHQYMVFRAVK